MADGASGIYLSWKRLLHCCDNRVTCDSSWNVFCSRTSVSYTHLDVYKRQVENMVHVKDTFVPNPEAVALYERMLPVYQSITTYTDEVLKKSYEIFQ